MELSMTKSSWKINFTVFFIILSLCCCAGRPKEPPAAAGMITAPLRIGITTNYPPLAFRSGNEVLGLEADLAVKLSQKLERPLQFVELSFDQQIPALLAGKTDMIMSGMTITRMRELRILFTDPYLKSGLMVAMRAADARKYRSLAAIKGSNLSVGVIKGTTGEVFVYDNFPKDTKIVPLSESDDAPQALKSERIDFFVHDAPSIVWLISENEVELKTLWEMLNNEYLGWGVRPDNQALISQVNAILQEWRQEGTLKRAILKWLPYWQDFD
jgi:ABC-type amino acid transport substrate-binding protein